MANPAQFDKDPSAVLPWGEDWSAWLGSDTISSVTVTATAGLTVSSPTNTTTLVLATLSGGVAGSSYQVTFHVTTAGGLQDSRSITINCVNR
jgi:hypothetical protein